MRLRPIAACVLLAACRDGDIPLAEPPPDSGDTAAPRPPGAWPFGVEDDTATTRTAPRNVVVILADDQAYDTLWAMPEVNARLVPEAITFERAYVTAPMCCPMRSSLLSGGWYPRDTGVLTNLPPMGGVAAFSDADTIATRLQAKGVATGLFGKYLNSYAEVAPYVPPGWDRWVATAEGDGGYDQSVVLGDATGGALADTAGQHITPFLFAEALAFVDAQGDGPFFVYLAPTSPHVSGSPEDADVGLYLDYAPRGPAWDEADVSDKPAWLQEQPPLTEVEITTLDANARLMLRNLASLDRSVAGFLDGLEARGVLDDTLVLYTSDNGYLDGEHRLATKGWPYEEAIHVPMLVRHPRVAPRSDTRILEVNTDLAATVLDLFGAEPTGEGLSLLDAFEDPTAPVRDHVFIDGYTSNGLAAPVWSGVVTERYKYVEWGSGDTELYDLVDDPYELDALTDDPTGSREQWADWIDAHRALAITTTTLPDAQVGDRYNEVLESWGGEPPFAWSVVAGELPEGLALAENGHLRGDPGEVGTFDFTVRVEDAGASPWTGDVHRYEQDLTLTVAGDETFVAARVTGERSGTTARFTLRARPGVTVRVRASLEPAMDGPQRVSAPVVVGAGGTAEVTLEDLRVDRAWYWIATYDGVTVANGVLSRPAL